MKNVMRQDIFEKKLAQLVVTYTYKMNVAFAASEATRRNIMIGYQNAILGLAARRAYQ